MFRVDNNEPTAEMIPLLIPTLGEGWQVEALNAASYSDYMWANTRGCNTQVERKQWGEVLADTDKVEEQLLRHLNLQPKDEHVLLLEGVATTGWTGTQVLKMTNKGIMVKGQTYSSRLKGIYSWLYQVQTYMQVVQTTTLRETATALIAMYESDQKDETEHRTFLRHIKATTFHPNPMVVQLMGACPGLGDKRASALIAKFSTVYGVLSARPADLVQVEGIGPTLARQILQRAGRTDI